MSQVAVSFLVQGNISKTRKFRKYYIIINVLNCCMVSYISLIYIY